MHTAHVGCFHRPDFKISPDVFFLSSIIQFIFVSTRLQMDMPRQKHQTQPLYTAPRLSERYSDRVSPLNNRRSNNDNYHDNKSTSMQSQRQSSKSLRRHSTNAYTTSNIGSQKELSPTQQPQLQQQMNNNSSR